MRIASRENAEHYNWKKVCDGWHFVQRDDLSIIVEKMPPHTAEDMHYHRQARQFFYILSGEATMRFTDQEEVLNAGEGVEIDPGEAHQMTNNSDTEIEFLVVSMPKSHEDKVIIQKQK